MDKHADLSLGTEAQEAEPGVHAGCSTDTPALRLVLTSHLHKYVLNTFPFIYNKDFSLLVSNNPDLFK